MIVTGLGAPKSTLATHHQSYRLPTIADLTCPDVRAAGAQAKRLSCGGRVLCSGITISQLPHAHSAVGSSASPRGDPVWYTGNPLWLHVDATAHPQYGSSACRYTVHSLFVSVCRPLAARASW